MIPYDTPSTFFDRMFGPHTALTPKIVAHGGGHNLRVLKGNPVGYIQHPDGQMRPYLSARGEHQHQPVEGALIQHAKLGTVAVDHYHLGQIMPAQHAAPVKHISPSGSYPNVRQWPDTSVASTLVAHPFPQGGPHPGPQFGKGVKYGPAEGVVRKP